MLTTHQVVHSRDHPGRAEYLYLLMLQDYVTSTLYHIQAAKEQLCRQLPNTAGEALTIRKNNTLKDTDYLIESLNLMTVHLGECQQQVKHLRIRSVIKLTQLTRLNPWKN